MNTVIDVCAVELAKKLNETSKAFPCSNGANELVAYLVSEKELEKFLMTAKECGFENSTWIQAAGVITTHGGPAAFGIAGFSK